MKLNKSLAKISAIILVCFISIVLIVYKISINKPLKSPIDLNFPVNVKFIYSKPFSGMINVVCEELPELDLPKEYMIEVKPVEKGNIEDNDIIVDGEKYHLIGFHFHVPSEHTINGKRQEGEIHFVHKNDSGKVAVVGVFITQGKELNPNYQSILEILPKILTDLPEKAGEGDEIELKKEIDVRKFLPSTLFCVYRYLGSKTSGSLDPGVKWIILTNPIEFSKTQLEKLQPIRSTGTKIHSASEKSLTIECCAISL
jgi:hypothetical protein